MHLQRTKLPSKSQSFKHHYIGKPVSDNLNFEYKFGLSRVPKDFELTTHLMRYIFCDLPIGKMFSPI